MASEAEVAVAWMVDCGNTDVAQGDVRFWRASRKWEAHGCALAHGTKAVPLYARPAPAGEAAEVERLRATNRDLHRRAQKAEGQVRRRYSGFWLGSAMFWRKRFETMASELHVAQFRAVNKEWVYNEQADRATAAEAALAQARAAMDPDEVVAALCERVGLQTTGYVAHHLRAVLSERAVASPDPARSGTDGEVGDGQG